MKLGKLVAPLLIMLALAVVIEAYMSQDPRLPVQGSVNQTPEPEQASRIKNTLALLLADTGIRVGDLLPNYASPGHKELLVRWQSPGSNARNSSGNLLRERGIGSVTILASARKDGRLPRERSFELSPNQILALALDAKGNLLWWKLMLDPRLVRAEAPAATGEMRGEDYYLTNVDFTIACPDNPAISEVRIYHPQWTGRDFRLELISSLPVDQ